MRKQVELKFFISYDTKHDSFEKDVIKLASHLCGGCYVGDGTGYWTEDGANHQPRFFGELQAEHCLQVVLSCEEHKAVEVYTNMRIGISAYAAGYKVDTDWVHVQKTEFTGMHFSAREVYEAMPRNVYRDIVSPGTRGARP